MSLTSELAQWRKVTPLPQPSQGGGHFGGRNWRRECGDKRAYFTLEGAKRGVEELAEKPGVHDAGGAAYLTVYVCRWCDWFHIGHQVPGSTKRNSTVYIHPGSVSGCKHIKANGNEQCSFVRLEEKVTWHCQRDKGHTGEHFFGCCEVPEEIEGT